MNARQAIWDAALSTRRNARTAADSRATERRLVHSVDKDSNTGVAEKMEAGRRLRCFASWGPAEQ
jgi:hypothetical protein